ncbi:acylphosphatase [Staphylococcus pettenkoferi]|uniref:acylphosphatase n=1 Tax=Staphylococcus pettenkoferi TaxID=170573 RepID=A0A9Q4D656_9STAP|nr:acylphosphatase [Staphylococcus pettenkoferi]ASE36049.1 acylphosphatase [Staphylococcus pettenkoferi]EHM70919.1 acylphosphatase [Staphylococcus pettenkoferi VCU012]MCY1569949.1 acylphosphatase [Staphylococcus pettenkoferi]MCY1576259.1 acylphosphatase [Staphylococcus pettenkoferi]MCY1580000.1 acylphosphatase [Staphylococcus pettenkoferi]
MERKHMKVYGTVQGVGFRYYTQKLAKKYGVVGTVQNVQDYVEIYAQGDAETLNQFVEAVSQGASPASKVEDVDIEALEVDESLKKFKTI